MSRYYIDCEFDGHNGPLLSIAAVSDDGFTIYITTTEQALDPWVLANVVPKLDAPLAEIHVSLASVPVNEVGAELIGFIGSDDDMTVVADSPVDIARFCQAISTDPKGGYWPCMAQRIKFEVHDVDCYPTTLLGAVQHNAWWDAMALKRRLHELAA